MHYIKHPGYAKDARLYVRAFLLIQKDLVTLFDYIEPCDDNKSCYSHRLHEILLRSSVEIEANFKAILAENGYLVQSDRNGRDIRWNMSDYRKVNTTHRLSEYEVHLPSWRGSHGKIKPFVEWSNPTGQPAWYHAYNETKHDRHESFVEATLMNSVTAVAGLFVLLSAQFSTEDFEPSSYVTFQGDDANFTVGIGDLFSFKPPVWSREEQYDFSYDAWQNVVTVEQDPFRNLAF